MLLVGRSLGPFDRIARNEVEGLGCLSALKYGEPCWSSAAAEVWLSEEMNIQVALPEWETKSVGQKERKITWSESRLKPKSADVVQRCFRHQIWLQRGTGAEP